MSLLVAAALGLLIGGVIGGLGGGGAVLTVPALVYLLGLSPQQATSGSLVIVGVAAVVGVLSHARRGLVRWRTGGAVGAAGLLFAYVGTRLNARVDPDLLLLGFAGVVLLAAAALLAQPRRDRSDDGAARPDRRRTRRRWRLAQICVVGAGVGLLTGFFGVGGGFVVVPALVLLLGFELPWAVGTSLLVVAVNSAAALASRGGSGSLVWSVVAPFTVAAVLGTLAGQRIADRLPSRLLTRAFAGLLLAVAVGIESAVALT